MWRTCSSPARRCGNVRVWQAHVYLLLARATLRKRELAISASMGAGRGRIISELLTESMLLSLMGGALGLGIGFAGLRALLALNPVDIPRIGAHGAEMALDARVLLYTL